MNIGSELQLQTLLSLFSAFPDSALRELPSAALLGLIVRLPVSQSVYENAATELLAEGLKSERQQETYGRLVAILRFLLYEDGRSESALYRLIDEVVTDEDTESLALNPLAALANYYHSGGKSAVSSALALEKLSRYSRIEPLFNNAMACIRNLQRNVKRSCR